MLRSFFQGLKDLIYDNVLSAFKSQQDIDIGIEDQLIATGAAVIYNDAPTGAGFRKWSFLSYRDAIKYASAIPSEYVTYAIFDDGDDEGNRVYEVWVQE